MCVIVAKGSRADLPEESALKNCWHSNSHGAGISYINPGQTKVRIVKGLMTWKQFINTWNKLIKKGDIYEDSNVIVHFRITTHGGTSKPNTHPFMVSRKLKDLQKLNATCDMAAAHNGILGLKPRQDDISDSMEFVLSVLAPAKDEVQGQAMRILIDGYMTEEASKLAVLTKKGLSIFGKGWVEDKPNKLFYSNDSYEPPKWGRGYMVYGNAYEEYYGDDPYFGTEFNANTSLSSQKHKGGVVVTEYDKETEEDEKTFYANELDRGLDEMEVYNQLIEKLKAAENVTKEEDISSEGWDILFREFDEYHMQEDNFHSWASEDDITNKAGEQLTIDI
jgi:hypothetical protein